MASFKVSNSDYFQDRFVFLDNIGPCLVKIVDHTAHAILGLDSGKLSLTPSLYLDN